MKFYKYLKYLYRNSFEKGIRAELYRRPFYFYFPIFGHEPVVERARIIDQLPATRNSDLTFKHFVCHS